MYQLTRPLALYLTLTILIFTYIKQLLIIKHFINFNVKRNLNLHFLDS
jgi:hypothetical protein